MATQVQPVIIELRVDASQAQQGSQQYSAALDKAEKAANALTNAADRTQLAITNQSNAMSRAKAANDNLAAANDNVRRSYGDWVDGATEVGHSLENTTANVLNTINHLKLLALGAYALSPAFRSAINSAIPTFFGLIGTAATQALRGILSFAGPMLAFFAQITAPIAAAVVAWKALLAVWQQGADLLDKYANYNRKMFTPEGGAAALAEATKYQQGALSADQIRYAAELGTRLDDANRKIDAFLKVNINVTNLALNLQAVWVNIVEVIASAVTKLQTFLDGVPGWIPKAIGILAQGLPVIGPAIGLARGLNAFGDPNGGAPASTDDAMRAARATLAAGMAAKFTKGPLGGSFDARFWNFATGEPDKPDAPKANAYDRAVEGIRNQIDLLKLEADGVSKTSKEYQELKVAHELNIAAMKAGIEVTPRMREEWKKLGDEIADYTIKVNQARVVQSETFKRDTMFLSPGQQAAANAARQIDPTNWTAHLDDAGAKMAEFNYELGQAHDLSTNFLQSFNSDLVKGTVNMQTLTNAVQGLQMKLLDMAENQIINQFFNAFSKNLGGGFGNWFSGLFGQSPFAGPVGQTTVVGPMPSAMGNIFDRGNVIPFALGGLPDIVSSPTLFPMANGGTGLAGEAGEEAIMPLRRGSDGRLGLQAAGGGSVSNMVTIAPVIQIQGGSTKADQEQANMMSKSIVTEIEAMIDRRLIKQMRPNGLLRAS